MSSKNWFDITPVAGTRKARLLRLAFSAVRGLAGGGWEPERLQCIAIQLVINRPAPDLPFGVEVGSLVFCNMLLFR